MTDKTVDASFGKSVKEFWHALLPYRTHYTGWIGFLIKNINLPQEKKSELFWDTSSKNMDTNAENEGLKKFEASRDEKLKKYLMGSNIVLDYGCGTGTTAIKFSGAVQEIRGIDFSSSMIDGAKRKAMESKIENANFMQATIFDERLKEGIM